MATAAQEMMQMLGVDTQGQLETLAAALDSRQLLWASGYLAGRAALGTPAEVGPPYPVAAPSAQPGDSQAGRVLVLYASETGNSRRVAEALAERLRGQGQEALLADLVEYNPRHLRREKLAVLVTATHGLGDPPEGTEAFFEYWHGDDAPSLEGLRYAVLALGDSSYDDFCKVGIDLDLRLETLGATRLRPRVDCDLDFEDAAQGWSDEVAQRLEQERAPEPASAVAVVPHIHAVPDPVWSRARPFAAEMLVDQRITGRESTKEVRHIELSLEDASIDYRPGDSLGVWPRNSPDLVDELLDVTRLDTDTAVRVDERDTTLGEALIASREITTASRGFVQAYAAATGDATLAARAAEKGLKAWLDRHQVIDIVADHPHAIGAQAFVDCLRKLTPRLYSIASSPDANPAEAHLTVARVAYEAFGRMHAGAASGYLSAKPAKVPVFVEPNDRFRLPGDGDTPVIMIGAGTGVAPYRAFLQHRQHHGASGANWLIFGDRNLRSDFLYQIEMLRYRRDGLLTHLDVAFSRDQREKRYVQHCLVEKGAEIYAWLEQGAHLYVCGDAQHMAPDVDAALRSIVASHGDSRADAGEYLASLKRAGRYLRDVY